MSKKINTEQWQSGKEKQEININREKYGELIYLSLIIRLFINKLSISIKTSTNRE